MVGFVAVFCGACQRFLFVAEYWFGGDFVTISGWQPHGPRFSAYRTRPHRHPSPDAKLDLTETGFLVRCGRERCRATHVVRHDRFKDLIRAALRDENAGREIELGGLVFGRPDRRGNLG
jgi:hypothetical protein